MDEGSAFGGKGDVACKSDVGTGAGSHTIHSAYHWFFESADFQDDGVVCVANNAGEIGSGFDGFCKILSGTESTSGSGEANGTDALIGCAYVKCGLHLLCHACVKTIECVRAVEGEVGDVVSGFEEDMLVHLSLWFWILVISW